MDLLKLREEIDRIDEEIVGLYERRMEISRQVAEYKIEHGRPVFDAAREKEKIAMIKSLAGNEFNQLGAGELFEQIMAMSRKLQYQLLTKKGVREEQEFTPLEELPIKGAKAVFQGVEGSYSQAAMAAFFGKEIDNFHVESFRDAMESVAKGRADFAVLPIENSTAGAVNEIYDLLMEYDHYIVGEQIIGIEHCLLVNEGTELSDIKRVYTHPQSLMQSAKFLNGHRDWQQIGMLNNAFAAKKVAGDKDKSQAAIASAYAGQVYGLKILKKGVNDSSRNATRFIIVSGQRMYRKNADKVSICFEIPHQSGSLYHMLSHFIFNRLNMNRIESRPVEERNWEYRFFVDFEGNLSDPAVKNALRGLKEEAAGLRILGNY